MHKDKSARLIALVLLAAALLVGVSSLRAAEPTGISPSDGQTVTCQVKNLSPAGTTWYKIPYHKGVELEIDLTAIDGVYFDVFAPDQVRYWPAVGAALGTSADSATDPVYLKTWQGHLEQADFVLDYYYVRVTNLLGFEVSYILCSHETASTIVEPTGDSPANGLTAASCALLILNPTTQVWHRIPYHGGNELEVYLKTVSTDASFDVFTPEQVKNWPALAQPIGRGTVNKNEPDYAMSWQGHLPSDDSYSVLVRNAGAVSVQYQLCWVERKLEGLPPTRTPRPTSTPRP
ncbi:MAG TPA: hypothetical protein VF478_03640 [Anaerolineae bacterium]